MPNTAILIIDVQNSLMNKEVFQRDVFISAVKRLVAEARGQSIPIMYVQHNDTDGGELKEGTDPWRIYDEVAPLPGETVIAKQYNSAFRKTDLKAKLDTLGVDTLVLAGMMTEYCVNATCCIGFEYGYTMLTSPEINTTLVHENGYMSTRALHGYYNTFMWHNRYASVMPLEALCGKLRKT